MPWHPISTVLFCLVCWSVVANTIYWYPGNTLIGIGILIDLWRRNPSALRSAIARTGLALVAGALPFLLIQLAFDKGVTGRWLHTPHDAYGARYNPGVSYGLREPDLTLEPQTTLAQKRIYFTSFVKPFAIAFRTVPWSDSIACLAFFSMGGGR